MTRIHIATALVRRGDYVLLVASTYPNHARPLWNLPGGRQQARELAEQTALRELREETTLQGIARELLYVSESYDGDTHFTNFTFAIDAQGEARLATREGDHVVALDWVNVSAVRERVTVSVVREPLLAALNGSPRRYFAYAEAGISIVFPD